MNKTSYKFDWNNGYTKAKKLTRSFDTIEEARCFANGKADIDIYKSKGKYKVEWTKVIDNN